MVGTNQVRDKIAQYTTSFFEKNGSFFILSFLVLIFLIYISRKINLEKENCKVIKNNSQTFTFTFYSFDELRNANYFKSGPSNNYNCKLKDFYFKSAYNCFCSGIFRNDYVDKCALNNCAKSGVRFLDMQIFSLNKLPIIAVNHNDDLFQKTTYNYIDFDKGMKQINDKFLKSPSDSDIKNFPLFLHLKLNYASIEKNKKNEEKRQFYDKVHDILIDVFDKDNQLFTKNQKIFYNDYDDSREKIIANLPIEQCENKVFIFITLNDNSSNRDNFKKSKLNEITDLLSTDEKSIEIVRSDEIMEDNYISFQGLANRKMVASFPRKGEINNSNYDFSDAASNGIQFMCMNFQRFDSFLNVYNDFFVSQIGSSSQNVTSPMIKKPDILIDTTITGDSMFVPRLTYKIKTVDDNKICYDPSGNDTDPMICGDVSNSNYQLFNIYQSPDDPEKYYFKTTIKEKICDLSSEDDFVYCNVNAPGNTSYFKISRTGADKFKLRNDSNNKFCVLDANNKMQCNQDNMSGATNFSIEKTLL